MNNIVYSDFSESLFVNSSIQGGDDNGGSESAISYTVDSATLTATPEPTTLAMFALLGALTLLSRRPVFTRK